MQYAIIKSAIERRESLTGKYEEYIRHFSPHVLGEDRQGAVCVLGFQYGGGRPRSLPSAGDWCFFQVDKLRDLYPNGDRWLAGPFENKPLYRFARIEVQA